MRPRKGAASQEIGQSGRYRAPERVHHHHASRTSMMMLIRENQMFKRETKLYLCFRN